jgi:hypothetical protein
MYDELPSSKQAPCLLGIIEATRGAPRLTPALRASLAARACSAAEHVLAKGGAVAALLACARLLAAAAPAPGAPAPGAPALTPAGAVQRALRAADAAPGAEAPGLFVDCLEAALALALPGAFVGELALLCSEYVGWAAKGGAGGGGGGAALGERFEALRPRVAAVTGRPVAASGAAAAPVAAAPAPAAPAAAAPAPAPEAPAQQQQQQPQFSASAAAEDL